MTYKEVLEKYKSGQLSESEALKVKEEIERYNAISEFLFDQEMESDFDYHMTQNDNTQVEDSDITQAINTSIKKAFIRAGIITGIAAVIIALLIVFAAPHIVSNFYYNPGSNVYEDAETSTNKMTQDMTVYSELQIPELGPNVSVSVDNNGYGKYNTYMLNSITLPDGDIYNNGYAGKITRNHNIWYDPYSLEFASGNTSTFAWDEAKTLDSSLQSQGIKGGTSGYPDDSEMYAYVTLDKMTSYSDFVSLCDDAGLMENRPIWCAIKTDDKKIQNYGFFVTPGADRSAMLSEGDNSLLTWAANSELTEAMMRDEKNAIQHFTSMIDYLVDDEEFLETMESYPDIEGYKNAAEYVEKNGIQVYGFMTIVNSKELENLTHNKLIHSIDTKEM